MAALSIITALNSLKTATEMAKLLRSADSAFDKAGLKIKVAELAEALAEARVAVLDAQSELEELRARVTELEAVGSSRASLVRRDNVYWFAEPTGEQGPYCPRCFESARRRMPVTKLSAALEELAKYRCPECRATY